MDGGTDIDLDERLRRLFLARSVLVLEDDPELAGHLASVLSRHGFGEIEIVTDGSDAAAHAARKSYDLLIFDRQVPGLDGLSALEHVRAGDGPCRRSAALLLTAFGTERQKIEGLASGADDYIVKPVADVELLARIAALLRRGGWVDDEANRKIENGPIEIDAGAMTATMSGQPLDLTPRELAVLSVLAENVGLPVTRSMLWSRCWSDYNFMPSNATNTIDVHVSRLRKKLDACSEELDERLKPLIVAVRSQGLMLRDLSAHS